MVLIRWGENKSDLDETIAINDSANISDSYLDINIFEDVESPLGVAGRNQKTCIFLANKIITEINHGLYENNLLDQLLWISPNQCTNPYKIGKTLITYFDSDKHWINEDQIELRAKILKISRRFLLASFWRNKVRASFSVEEEQWITKKMKIIQKRVADNMEELPECWALSEAILIIQLAEGIKDSESILNYFYKEYGAVTHEFVINQNPGEMLQRVLHSIERKKYNSNSADLEYSLEIEYAELCLQIIPDAENALESFLYNQFNEIEKMSDDRCHILLGYINICFKRVSKGFAVKFLKKTFPELQKNRWRSVKIKEKCATILRYLRGHSWDEVKQLALQATQASLQLENNKGIIKILRSSEIITQDREIILEEILAISNMSASVEKKNKSIKEEKKFEEDDSMISGSMEIKNLTQEENKDIEENIHMFKMKLHEKARNRINDIGNKIHEALKFLKVKHEEFYKGFENNIPEDLWKKFENTKAINPNKLIKDQNKSIEREIRVIETEIEKIKSTNLNEIERNSFKSLTDHFGEIKATFDGIKKKITKHKDAFGVFKKDKRKISLESVDRKIENEFSSKGESLNKIKSDLKDLENKIQKDFDDRDFQTELENNLNKNSKETKNKLQLELHSKHDQNLTTFENNISNEERELKNFLPTKLLFSVDEENKRIADEDKFRKVITRFEKIKTLFEELHIKITKLEKEITKFSYGLINSEKSKNLTQENVEEDIHELKEKIQEDLRQKLNDMGNSIDDAFRSLSTKHEEFYSSYENNISEELWRKFENTKAIVPNKHIKDKNKSIEIELKLIKKI